MNNQTITFLIKCEDRKGLVAKITGFFYNEGFNILSCQQHVNKLENKYFMRIHLQADSVEISGEELEMKFDKLATPLEMTWSVNYEEPRKKVAIFVCPCIAQSSLLARFKVETKLHPMVAK